MDAAPFSATFIEDVGSQNTSRRDQIEPTVLLRAGLCRDSFAEIEQEEDSGTKTSAEDNRYVGG